jgi:hypothetical protein
MCEAKTFAARITVDFLPSAFAALDTIASQERRTMTGRAYCGGREIGPDYPTREAAIRAVRAYHKHYPSCRYLIRQVKQYWGLQY